MSTWRVEQHYGFGAGRVAIRPEVHRAGRASLRDGLAAMREELTAGGPRASLRRIAGETPALLLGLLIASAFIVTLTRDYSDRSEIEMVILEPAPALPEPPLEEEIAEIPPPEPVVAEPPPLAPTEPVVAEPPPLAPPEPKPSPTRVAERPEPPPPPPSKPNPPERARPRPPAMPRLARVEPPPAPERKRIERAVRERVEPSRRPTVAVASLKPGPESAPSAPLPRMQRMAPAPLDTPNAPRLNAPAPPRVDLPSDAPTPRAFRVATARPTRGERHTPLAAVAPAAAPHASTPAPPPERTRPSRPAAPRPSPRSIDRVAMPTAAAPAVTPAAAAPPPAATRTARAAPQAEARRAPRPAAAPAHAPRLPLAAPAPVPTRVKRAAAEVPAGPKADRPGLAGVPLGDLAACVSDREEDRLKQAVVAAVTTQKECVSRAGTYRFVETRNLNAFLMWVDRAPSRPVEDRCGELRHALECLETAGRRAAR